MTLVLLLLPATGAATTARLQKLLSQMPCLPVAEGDTLFDCPAVAPGRRFVLTHDGKGTVTHLGLSVFTPEVKRLCNPYLCNYVERVMLECLLAADEAARTQLMREERVKMMMDGFPLGQKGFLHFADCLPLFVPGSTMAFDEEENSYCFRVTASDGGAFTMVFPKDRELIFGTDKKEQDEAIGRQLALGLHRRLAPRVPAPSQVEAVDDGLWRWPGSAYLIDSLRSDLYYTRQGGTLVPVYDSAWPTASVVNLLMGQIAQPEVQLDLIHRQYGLKAPGYRLSIEQLHAALVEPQAQCYAVARLIGGGKEVTAVLIILHPQFQYLDMLTLTAPVETLFGDVPVVKAYLYTNVPQHNVLELFEERIRK